ncbi:hypothetical protein TVAG_482000 [Trichomonas vaginalis G3]|uniref:Sel1 repeat family protein n=1 Tax=Trichomonas vaginalis (strain ATCC PRA-98 / G3) TaxID=412133 RepID=A2EBK9_TRIV3|nr:tetratricopeptide repeat domain domain-containing protein [Trichomonas vaginalis G3]EAY09926.1 hypothetical protein TVAG_482000 [Trichomonas vaginalis G3]KAI5523064.1 tetratricopeptide repeat domain domain-containing protein [Trichomonas vaginalis G3]|eukprot:XP_001322149.1 hypothetical protein [Trichomonas vaginalis G3]
MIKTQYKDLYEWKYTDNSNYCTVEFNFPEEFNADCIEYKLNEEKTAIIVTIPQYVPIVCGLLFAKALGIEASINNTTYTFKILKEKNEPWPILIKMIHPEFQMVDPKSAFLIFQQLSSVPDDENSHKLAYQFLENSARVGYLYALQVLGGIYLDTESREKEGMALLKQGADQYNEPLCCFQVGLLYATRYGDVETGIQYLIRSGEGGYGVAYFTLGQIYSPISNFQYDHKDAKKAMEYFNLVQEEHISPALLTEMSQFYEQGLGVEKDLKKAEELRNRANDLLQKIMEDAKSKQQDLSNDQEVQQDVQVAQEQPKSEISTAQTIGLVGAVSAFVVGFGYMVYKRLSK